MASHGNDTHRRRCLIIVEKLPVPFDRRVWNEATPLAGAGNELPVICPVGQDAKARYEVLDGIHIYRHPLPEARGALGYIIEYSCALFWEFVLAFRVHWTRGFDAI